MKPLAHISLRQRGISMVEVLVAMAIGVVIMAGVMQSLLTNQRNDQWSEDISYIQENARYALEMLARDIRWAGYWGCAVNYSSGKGITSFANSLNGGAGSDWLDMSALRGYEGGVSAVPGGMVGAGGQWKDNANYVGSTAETPDALILRGADGDLDLTVVSHNAQSAQFKLSRNNPMKVGDLAIVVSEDCRDVGLMQMTGPSSGGTNIEFVHNTGASVAPGNCTKAIRSTTSFDCSDPPAKGIPYGPGSAIMRFAAIGYYVGTSAADARQPALYRVQLSGFESANQVTVRADEIAMGVEDMQILYGIDNNADALADAYVRANQIDTAAGEWLHVVSVRLVLLMRGYGQTRQAGGELKYVGYPYAGSSDSYAGHGYDDRILRQQVIKTVQLRNVAEG